MCVGWLLVGLALSICESFIIARKRNRKISWATLVDCVTLSRARFEVWAGRMYLLCSTKFRQSRMTSLAQQSPPDCHSLLHHSNSQMCLCVSRCEMKQDEQKKNLNYKILTNSRLVYSIRLLKCSRSTMQKCPN